MLDDESSGDGSNRVRKDDRGKASCPATGLTISGCRRFSPCGDIEKMKHGVPLTDEDREPRDIAPGRGFWLGSLRIWKSRGMRWWRASVTLQRKSSRTRCGS
jgi:hypothetical protein